MNKHKILSCIAAGLLAVSAGCSEDIVNTVNENGFNTTTYFKTEKELEQGSTAVYAGLYFGGLWSREYYFIFDLLGNDAQVATALQGELAEFAKYTYRIDHGQINVYWRSLYRIVLRANLVIDQGGLFLAKEPDNANVKRYIGEAYFLRAYAYFELASQFGRVPLKLTMNDYNEVRTPRVANVADVWAVVEEDLKNAEAMLPASYPASDLGRATTGAASALLGKAYLYQKKYAEAITEFSKLDGKYTLVPGAQWNDNFSDQDAKENNAESVFEVQLKHMAGTNTWYMFGGQEDWGAGSTHSGRPMEYGFNDWQNVFISDAAVAQFRYDDEAGDEYIDPRAAKTFYGGNGLGDDQWCDNCNITTANVAANLRLEGEWDNGASPLHYNLAKRGYRFKKYQNYETKFQEGLPEGDNNGKVIRYADVLLMHAEALIMTGNTADGIALINKVRQRVGAFTYAGAYNQAEAMALIKRERHLELCGEQVRFRDLVRWGDAKAVLNAELSAQYDEPGKPTTYFFDKHVLFPIPISELDTNPAVRDDVSNAWN
jgi:hypothetical protein